MSSAQLKHTIHALIDHHPLKYMHAKADDMVARVSAMLHAHPDPLPARPLQTRRRAPADRHRWWDLTTDEALFWREGEHQAQQQRMDRLRRGLSNLRGPRSGRGFSG